MTKDVLNANDLCERRVITLDMIKYESLDEGYYFLIDVTRFMIAEPEYIEFDIYLVWEDKMVLLPASFPYYNDNDLIEYAIDECQRKYYEQQRGV